MVSFVRRIDKAGRLVIPMELRRMLDLQPDDEVVLHFVDGGVFLRPMPKYKSE